MNRLFAVASVVLVGFLAAEVRGEVTPGDALFEEYACDQAADACSIAKSLVENDKDEMEFWEGMAQQARADCVTAGATQNDLDLGDTIIGAADENRDEALEQYDEAEYDYEYGQTTYSIGWVHYVFSEWEYAYCAFVDARVFGFEPAEAEYATAELCFAYAATIYVDAFLEYSALYEQLTEE